MNVQIQAAGTAQLGAISRPMQTVEHQLFEDSYGYPPLAMPVAMDAQVVVNQENSLVRLNAQAGCHFLHYPPLPRAFGA